MEASLSAGVFPMLLFITTFLGFINSLCFAQSTIHLGNETDRMALLAFKEKIINDPKGVLSSWNNSLHFCMWSGVTCSRGHPPRVQTLNLTAQRLGGSLSPHIGNLSFLWAINLSGNNLEGSIPQEIVVQSKKSREKLVSTLSMEENFLRVTYAELYRATNGFSSTNLIGVGSCGSVYRGIIDRMEMIVAIKVLKLHQQRASKSFRAECRALRSIQHRNIVKVFTICSTFDLISGNDFKALVLEYMPNGSLDDWLHQSENELHPLKILNLIHRLNLAIDMACALDYLHNHCRPPIVHCNLKPSNILLDDDMVAHVSDFGLATIISEGINYSQCQTNSLAPMGSIGYIAPEYGMGANPSTDGDVYSFGILLLEMVTGKRPSDDMFKDDLSLHQFAKMALPESVMDIIDRRLLSEEIEIIRHNRSMMHKCLVSLVNIGVSCSVESPKARKEMKDVIAELHEVRDFYLAATVVRNV